MMMLPELSNHVIATMFLASLLLLAQGQLEEDTRRRREDTAESSPGRIPKGLEMEIFNRLQFKHLLPRLLHSVQRERQSQDMGKNIPTDHNQDHPLDMSLASRQQEPGKAVEATRLSVPRPFFVVRHAPVKASQRATSYTQQERRKRAKMLINNLAALFSDLRNGESKGSLMMPSLRIG